MVIGLDFCQMFGGQKSKKDLIKLIAIKSITRPIRISITCQALLDVKKGDKVWAQ